MPNMKATDFCPAHADPYASIPELNADQSKKDSQKHPSDPKLARRQVKFAPKQVMFAPC